LHESCCLSLREKTEILFPVSRERKKKSIKQMAHGPTPTGLLAASQDGGLCAVLGLDPEPL
jgi:hypothetical protein